MISLNPDLFLKIKISHLIQLRDHKNDFIFNFNFDDKMKFFWTVWISRKINEYCSTPEKMCWANAHLNLCKLLETELSSCNFILRFALKFFRKYNYWLILREIQTVQKNFILSSKLKLKLKSFLGSLSCT